MYVDAVGPSLGTVAAILDADSATLLVMATGGAAAPIAVLAEWTPMGLTLEERRDDSLPPSLGQWLAGTPATRTGGGPPVPRDYRHEGASLAVPLPADGEAALPSPSLLLVERRSGPPFSARASAIAHGLARRLASVLARGMTEEAARARLDAALGSLGSDGDARDVSKAILEAVAAWTGARDVVLRLPRIRAGTPSITAQLDGGAFTWDEGDLTRAERPSPQVQDIGDPEVRGAWRPDAGDAATAKPTARASIPLLDEVVASLDVSWDPPPGVSGLARLAAAASAAAPVMLHIGERLARNADRRRVEEVAGGMHRIVAAQEARTALRALLESATTLARADGASVRLERGIFGQSPAFVNILRRDDGAHQWTDTAVATDEHTDEALRLGGASRAIDLVAESEAGNVLAHQLLQGYGFESGLIVPIRARGLVVGTLRLASRRRGAFDGIASLPLQVLADHAGAVVEQALLESRAAERTSRLQVARQIAAAVNTADGLDRVARRLLDAALEVTGSPAGEVALVDADGAALRTRARSGIDDSAPQVQRLYAAPAPDEGELAATMRMAAQRVVDARSAGHEASPRTRALLTPIMHGDAAIGVLSLEWGPDSDIEPARRALARIVADQAGGAIARARLAQSERAARAALTTALEASSTVILSLSFAGLVTGAEGDAMAMLGLPAQRILHLPFLHLFAPAQPNAEIAALLPKGEGDMGSRQLQARAHHRDGRQVPVLVAVGPRFEGQRHVGTVAAMTDLTEMAALAEELDEANAARSRAEGAVRTGRAIAHDLGSPLSSILALSELLVEDGRLPGGARRDVEMLFAEAVRASTLLHRFGRITRYEELLTPMGPQLDVDKSTEA